MIRHGLLVLALCASFPSLAEDVPVPPAPPAVEAAPSPVAVLPAMSYAGSIAEDELLAILKENPAFSALDKELVGAPLTLVVTHTMRPTAGGQAAGMFTAFLSGSTLGILPIVTNQEFVVRYEVQLNGKTVTQHSFERTATRAINLWANGNDRETHGLGKAGMDWLKATTVEAAARLAADPELAATRREIDYFFGPAVATAR